MRVNSHRPFGQIKPKRPRPWVSRTPPANSVASIGSRVRLSRAQRKVKITLPTVGAGKGEP